jgi:hypothetical protein
MTQTCNQGVLSHTLAARPYWVADVDVTAFCLPRHRAKAQTQQQGAPGGLHRALTRLLAEITGR